MKMFSVTASRAVAAAAAERADDVPPPPVFGKWGAERAPNSVQADQKSTRELTQLKSA